MDKRNHFLLDVNIQQCYVRPRRSPTGKQHKLETIETDIQKGLAELKELM